MGNDSCRKRIDRERQTTQSQHANSSPTNSDVVLLEILKTDRLFENHLLCDSPEHKYFRRRNVCETQAAIQSSTRELHYDMEPTQLPRNFSIAVSGTTAFCYPYPNVYFENVGSIVPYTVNAALNVLMAIVAIFGNSLVVAAVRHSTSIRLPSKLLLCSLVLTDVGVGLVAQPQFVAFLITKVTQSLSTSCLCLQSFGFSGLVLCCASLLTMTAISLDRYIALFFHIKYHQIVTTRRVCVVLVIIWLSAVFFAWTWVWIITLFYSLFSIGLFVIFLVTPVVYIKIYRGLRRHHGQQVQAQTQVQAQQHAGNTLNVAKYRRSASSMLWIYGIFIVCYLPYTCCHFIEISQSSVIMACIKEFSVTIVFLNSCLNPFIYCFRLPEIRAEVMQILRKMRGQISQQ